MENMQQLLVLTDDHGNPVGVDTRKKCHRTPGRRHWGFVLLVKDKAGKFIIARRADTKSCGAGLWDASVVSHVLPGETVPAAAARRSRQELAITVKNVEEIGAFVYTAQYGKYCENEYCSVLVGVSDETPHPHPAEISQLQFMTFEQLSRAIKRDADQYAPWFTIAVEKFADKIARH